MPQVVPPDPQIRAAAEAARRADADRVGADAHLRSSEAVHGYGIQASDDFVGRVADFLFDEETWAIRYLVAGTGKWLDRPQLLVASHSVREVNWAERTLSVSLTRREVDSSPEYDPEHLPSREYFEAHADSGFRSTS
ncbi:MAG: hypothetical protein ACT4O5_04475 [Gammaproteobacteria bacterium]